MITENLCCNMLKRCKLGTLLIILFILLGSNAWSQLFVQSGVQTGAAGTGNGVPMIGTPGANVLFSSAGKVNAPFGTGNTPCTNGYSGFTTPIGINAYTPSGPAIEITLTPASGFVLFATGISSRLRYSATGPSTATYAYSIDGGITWINNGNISMPQVNCQSGSVFTWNFPCAVIVGNGQNFKFRIYFFGATGGTGTTQIENLTVNGNAIACTAPTASISGTTTICGGGSSVITFTGTPSSTVSYNINGGPNLAIVLNCAGTATLNTGILNTTTTYNLVTAGFGNCLQSLSGSAVVTVIPPVSSAILSGSTGICSGSSTNLSVNITGGVSPYTVVYSNGSTNTTINNYTSGTPIPVSPTINTTYTLVSVNGVSGCSSLSGSAVITISPKPTSAILSGTATTCNGNSTNLSVAITGGSSPYTVTYFNGVSNTTINNYISGSSISVSPTATTTYTLVSVNSAAGCSATSISGTAIVTVRPTLTPTVSGTTTVCQNAASPTISFNNSQALPVIVTYTINGGSPLTLNITASATATVSAPTATSGIFVYNLVSAAYQSAPTCMVTISGQSATITVSAPYTAAILSGNATICSGNSTNLAVNITGGVSPYTITYFNGVSNNVVSNYNSGSPIPVFPVANTTYTLISVTGAGGCGGTGMGGTATVTVTAPGTWLGLSNNWNDPQNWCDGNIPTSSTNVTIPAGVSFFPLITTTNPTANNITIAATASMSITATGTFSFAGSVTNNGTISNNGTIVLYGTSGIQAFPGPGTIAPMNNLTINNAAGVNLNKSLNIGGTLSLTNGLFTIGAFTLTLNNPITGTASNLSANNTSSITIAGTAAGINIPASVSQLKSLTVSNSSGTILEGNMNIATLLFISATAGTVDADIYTLDGPGNLQMSGGNLVLGKNGVVLPELTGTYAITGGTVSFNGVGIGSDAQTVRAVNYFNLSSTSTGDRVLSNTGIIGIANVFTPSTNLYTVTGSTVNFNKTNVQNIPGFTFYNLSLSGGNFIKNLAADISIKGVLSFAINTKLALGNFNVSMRSDASNTATVASMPTANAITYGTGRFIVERYIPVGISHIKSWQLLSVPTTTGQTINEAWQEGATGSGNNPVPGYGTQITSYVPGALGQGFDFYTPSGSTMNTYNPVSNQWESVPSTSIPIANNKGYMLFVRGDRSVTAYNQPAIPTVLRTKGKLFSPGTDAPSTVPVSAGRLQSVGNPYVSAIDFTSVLGSSAGIDSKYYVWDPLLPGIYGYGGYQTISSANGYIPIPGGTVNYPTGIPYMKIQPGQAFFVFSTPGGSVSFNETNKIAGNQLVYRYMQDNLITNRQSLRANLFTGTGIIADGNAVITDMMFDNGYEENDAIKISNFGENFGISNNGKMLAVDAKKPLTETDTLFYRIRGLAQQSYYFVFNPENFNLSGLTAFLVDRYEVSMKPVSLSDSTRINFNITSDPASKDSARFFIVFKKWQPVPVLFTNISATVKDKSNINVDWDVANETGISHYELQAGTVSTTLSTIFNTAARVNNGGAVSYLYTDHKPLLQDRFYRVMAVDADGELHYSRVVKVSPDEEMYVKVYPNPVTDNMFNILFSGIAKGKYNIELMDITGRLILKRIVTIDNNKEMKVWFNHPLASGLYQLRIFQGKHLIHFQKILVR